MTSRRSPTTPGLDRFALMGMAQGGPPAISYAARHPERVTRLLFYGSYAGAAAGSTREPGAARGVRAADQGRLGPAAAHLPAGLHLDDDPGGHRGADALARRAPAGRRLRRRPPPTRCASGRRPTASTCCPASTYRPWCCTRSRDQMNDFEHARLLAKRIPGARLVPLDSDNHILLGDEPAWQVFVDEVRAFLAPDGAPAPATRRAVRAGARGAGAWSPTALATTRSPPSWSSASAHGRAAPAERLREARRARPLGPGRRGGRAGTYVALGAPRRGRWVAAPMPSAGARRS